MKLIPKDSKLFIDLVEHLQKHKFQHHVNYYFLIINY